MGARIRCVSVGRVGTIEVDGEQVRTGIRKTPVPGPVRIGTDGLEGDEQADRRIHGGLDKAVLLYPGEHYSWWEERLGRTLTAPAFGENLTTDGLLESDVRVGDVWQAGMARLQVVGPRLPCRKLAAHIGHPRLRSVYLESGFTGFYARCLEEGIAQAGDPMILLDRDPGAPTVLEALREKLERQREA